MTEAINDAILYGRFSTAAQADGDSTRRQDEMAASYAKRHSLEIVRRYIDQGVSGWRGKNAVEGELRKIIDDTERGAIKPGTRLLVENFDRLSRLPISKSLELFTRLINLGLIVVDLSTEKAFTPESLNSLVDHIVAVLHMSRANEESNRKSVAVLKAKAAKRERARVDNGVKLTRQCPSWLRARGRGEQIVFEPIPERVSVVQEMFALCIAGYGRRRIANALNKRGAPSFRGKHGWHYNAVSAVLQSERVIGTFQPTHVVDEGKRRATVGEPIAGYYPEIITPAVFYQAQEALAQRRDPRSAGRPGAKFSNLFRGLTRCAQCGGSLVIVSHASHKDPVTGRRTRTKFLTCDRAMRDSDKCTNRRHHNYQQFEDTMLSFLVIYDVSALVGHAAAPGATRGAELEREIAHKTAGVDRLYDSIADGRESPGAKRAIERHEAEIAKLETELEQHRRRVRIAEANRGRDVGAEFKALLASLDDPDMSDAELMLLRSKLHGTLTRIIREVVADDTTIYVHVSVPPDGPMFLVSKAVNGQILFGPPEDPPRYVIEWPADPDADFDELMAESRLAWPAVPSNITVKSWAG